MIARGLNLSQIYITAIVFSMVAILSEVPSSYLADKWSRKGLITISIALSAFYWFTSIFAYGFVAFTITVVIFSISYSLMSGTDEALTYDSSRELGEESKSIKMLGRFYAAPRLFKMFGPLIAVLIARNLSNNQFILLLSIDVIANLIALYLSDYLVEPKHTQSNEKIQRGVLIDTIDLFKNSPNLINITINRTLLFLASFAIWRISSEYLTSRGATLLLLGLGITSFQAILFWSNMRSHFWFKKWNSYEIISRLNILCTVVLFLFWINEIVGSNWVVAIVLLDLIFIIEGIRGPYFSELINQEAHSYNRATTISGSNLLTEIIKLPLLAVFSLLIIFGYSYLFGCALLLGILSISVFRLTKKTELLVK
jgi:MFS family permease